MINDIIKNNIKIYYNNSELTITEKELIADKILNSIKKHNCYVFDYSDGENLIPIKNNISINDYIIPNEFYKTNKYLIKNKNCLELLNKCDGKGYKLENIIVMNRYLFDFDFDDKININNAIQQLKDIIIDYDLPIRCVYTGNRGVHIVFLSNKVNNKNDYEKVWNKLLELLNNILPNYISDYIDMETVRPNLYTRLPNINRNGNIQYLIYENLKYYEVVLNDTKQKNNDYCYINRSNKFN
jgi:hypothetical protein